MMEFTDGLIASYERHARERACCPPDEFKELEKKEFRQYLRSEGRVSILEIGCGPGHDARSFLDQGFRVLAVDNTPTMVELATEKGVSSRVLDCYHLDQMDQVFDAVYSMNCLLHIPQRDLGHVLRLIAARLNEGGLMYLGLWGGEDFEGIWDQDRYEPKRFFSFRTAATLLASVQQVFALEYYRRLRPRDRAVFHSVVARTR